MSHPIAPRSIVMLALCVLLVMGVVGMLGCAADEPVTTPEPSAEPAPAPDPEPADGTDIPSTDAARVLVESKCSGCHVLDRVWAKSQDQAGWEATVARMEANGLQVTDEERETIIEYLAGQ